MWHGLRSHLEIVTITSGVWFFGNCAIAQTPPSIVPDNTLGAESSIVTPNVVINGVPSDRIGGGATRGSNLFHSFQEFNIGEGRGAYFSNPTGVKDIFSRVTGTNRSEIMGRLGVLGDANLFLLNPNGIMFGPNASLDLRGSFLGSTANSIKFADGTEFRASASQIAPLLTMSVPMGLQFPRNSGNIINQSQATNSSGFPVDLQVDTGKNLVLVGGNVNFEGGRVTAAGGRVELGGLATEGTVGINNDGSLSFPDGVARGDVSLTNGAIAYVSAGGGGNIAVNARNLDILAGSRLLAGIQRDLGTPNAQAGDIVINATDNVRVKGNANSLTGIANDVGVVGASAFGNAGDIVVNTKTLEGIGNFLIRSSTFGQGDAGKISITATDKVSLQGLQGFSSGIASLVGSSAFGNADDIIINTPSLSLSNFARLATSTTGKGNAGNIQINASESISVSNNSVIQADTYASGNAGKIIIDAPNANVSFDKSIVTTSVVGNSNIFGVDLIGSGQGGDIKITARSLSLDNGAQLFTK
jgi:filamentous hemagglutinin family protein